MLTLIAHSIFFLGCRCVLDGVHEPSHCSADAVEPFVAPIPHDLSADPRWRLKS
jgi:hypothetical protein